MRWDQSLKSRPTRSEATKLKQITPPQWSSILSLYINYIRTDNNTVMLYSSGLPKKWFQTFIHFPSFLSPPLTKLVQGSFSPLPPLLHLSSTFATSSSLSPSCELKNTLKPDEVTTFAISFIPSPLKVVSSSYIVSNTRQALSLEICTVWDVATAENGVRCCDGLVLGWVLGSEAKRNRVAMITMCGLIEKWRIDEKFIESLDNL